MAEPRALSRPPIVEALVDFRATIGIPQADLEAFARDELREAFPSAEVKNALEAKLEVRDGRVVPPKVEDQGFHGIWLSNAGKTRIVQFRRNGFTLNHVKDYAGGDQLLDEGLSLWQQFANRFGATPVERVALRYINKLLLPYRPGDDFDRFLTAGPEMPPELPQLLAEFLTRVVASDRTVDGKVNKLIVTQHMHGEGDKPAIVLDIDVFREELHSLEQLRPTLDSLRELKNRTFFAMLTEATIAGYA